MKVFCSDDWVVGKDTKRLGKLILLKRDYFTQYDSKNIPDFQ